MFVKDSQMNRSYRKNFRKKMLIIIFYGGRKLWEMAERQDSTVISNRHAVCDIIQPYSYTCVHVYWPRHSVVEMYTVKQCDRSRYW